MKYLAITLALGDIYSNRGQGSLILPLDGSIHRLKAVTRKLPQNGSTLIVSTAGYSPINPSLPPPPTEDWYPPRKERLRIFLDRLFRRKRLYPSDPGRNVSLADQLFRYIQEEEPHLLKRVIARPLCWSTRNEIRMGIKLALRTGFAQKGSDVVLSVASNRTHLLRIWIYTHLLYTPHNWKIDLIPARHHFSLTSHLLEIPKVARDLLYAYRALRRVDRIKAIRLKK